MNKHTVGILAFHGDVIEHVEVSRQAVKNLHVPVDVVEVRTKEELKICDGLIIPGGESTTLHMLSEREGMWEDMKKIRYIFGTCAGAIMLAKTIAHKAPGQKTLERMEIEIDRNAYGRQADSFEHELTTALGKLPVIFIRAPKIKSVGKNVTVLAQYKGEILACEETVAGRYSLAACFHPELTSPIFHEYFLNKILN